jgi:hypothetical protein
MHAIETAQQGALAAARRADQRRDLVLAQLQIDIPQRVKVAIVKIEVLCFGLDPGRLRRQFLNIHGITT